ncbi:MAG: FliH/SctL family protein [Armatimonadota bacterium]
MNNIIKCDRSSVAVADPLRLRSLDGSVDVDPLKRARSEANLIISSAHAEAQSIRDEALAEGHRIGMEEGRRRVQELIHRLEADIASVAADREAVLLEIEPEVLKLCVHAVEKIIRHEIKTDPRIVLRVIKSCLRRVKDSSEVRIKVNPSELAEVRAQRDELLGLADGLRAVSIVDDRRISPGGCVVETSSGDFDATIETQLDRINKKLGDTYEDGRSHGSDEI